jgi:Tannase and feruloyl esterase
MEFMTGVSLDLFPFMHHGGKLIIYNSVNDRIFSGVDIVDWYEAMNRTMGGNADGFARLFMVPDMAHCGGGPATNSFAWQIDGVRFMPPGGVERDHCLSREWDCARPHRRRQYKHRIAFSERRTV